MIKALKARMATVFYRTGHSKTLRRNSSAILTIIFAMLFLALSPGGTGLGFTNANAQSYRAKVYRSPKQIAYNRGRRQTKRRGRRLRVVKKSQKSFLSSLFGNSRPKRRKAAATSLFSGFKLPGLLQNSPALTNNAYERRMRAATRNARGARLVSFRDGSRGWSFDHSPRTRARQGGQLTAGFGNGRYRTMCVRLCDGYYYPVSFKTGSRQFGQDEQRCNSGCYDAPTKLFYYSNPGSSIEDMRALDGTRYKDLANAFRYRKEYVADCRCKAAPWSPQARAQHESWAAHRKQAQLKTQIGRETIQN